MKRGSNASDEQPSNDEGNGRKCGRERPDLVSDDGVLGYQPSDTAENSTTAKM